MKFIGFKDFIKFSSLCFLLLTIFSCTKSGAESNLASPASANKNAEAQPAATSSEITDPTCCGLDYNREGIAQAWRQFTESGQFRLARASDMNFPDAAKREWGSDWEKINRPFNYAWGKRGFDTDKDHLVAIAVDTTRNDAERFGLVIFSSLSGSNEYRPYWLYRNRDLSRMLILASSGGLTLSEYNEGGTRKSCDVFWDPQSQRYICKPPRS
ncbi:MAG TPA: hypothetical protein VF543_19135 [Pyrinomonadaceae bacterium]|jgi:hypothetical protein